MVKSFTPAPGTSYSIFLNYHFSIYSQIAFFNKLHSPGVLVSRSLEVGPTNGGGDESFLSASAASLYLRERWVPGMCPQTHTHTHTHMLHGHHFNLQEMIWAVLFTQDFLQLKGECARSISFSFLLDLFISCQLCSYVYYGNLLFSSPPFPPLFFFFPSMLWEHYYSSCPRCCRCRCTQFNFSPLLQCEGRAGEERGGERQVRRSRWGEKREDVKGWGVVGAQQVDRFKSAPALFPFPWRMLS